ncbi:MAG: 4Fe-4S binding protein [Chloroflexi bacterium]|nr:4Fe-4S binding protein [Chloroflexota bacterium]
MNELVAVIGTGYDADCAAQALRSHGFRVERIVQGPSAPFQLSTLEGYVGSFALRGFCDGSLTALSVGAVVVATGNERVPLTALKKLPQHARIVSTKQLASQLTKPASITERASRQRQHIALTIDLMTPASREATREVIDLAGQLRDKCKCEVSVLYRELQVDTDWLEKRVRDLRAAGVAFHRLQAAMPEPDAEGITIRHADGQLRADLLGVAQPVRPRRDHPALAEALGIRVGEDGYLQPFNVHLYHFGGTARKGVYLVGRCHLDTDDSGVRQDAELVASQLAVLLTVNGTQPEAVLAWVDRAKCIRCLTCIRTCPHSAVELADAEGVTAAHVLEAACFGCGMCIANCPVQAISMRGQAVPAWLQEAAP